MPGQFAKLYETPATGQILAVIDDCEDTDGMVITVSFQLPGCGVCSFKLKYAQGDDHKAVEDFERIDEAWAIEKVANVAKNIPQELASL